MRRQRLLTPAQRAAAGNWSNQMSKTYSTKSNALRAARAELGATAQSGVDFELVFVEGGVTYERIVAQPGVVDVVGYLAAGIPAQAIDKGEDFNLHCEDHGHFQTAEVRIAAAKA